MAFWTIIGRGTEGNTQGKAFGLTLDTDEDTWKAGGPEVDMFFVTKSGNYKIVGIPESGTQLYTATATPKEVAFLKGLNGTSSIGDTGTGRASEKSSVKYPEAIDWQ